MEANAYMANVEKHIEIMSHFPPDINARIVIEALDGVELFKDEPEKAAQYEAQIEAAFEVEKGNTGMADFLLMVIKAQEPKN